MMLAWRDKTNATLDVPTPAAYGLDEAAWFGGAATMAEQALASGSPAHNPVVPSADEIVELYAKVWGAPRTTA